MKIEVHLKEKEAAHYFSNAAAVYVLGLGFGYFAVKAQTPFMTGVCFWFSVYFLCDCFRLTRVAGRLESSKNLLLEIHEKGFTHYATWIEPETRTWKEISGFRQVKTTAGDTIYFLSRARQGNFLRFALFGAPKFDMPLSCVPGGKEGFLKMLSNFPEARHLVPERAQSTGVEEEKQAA